MANNITLKPGIYKVLPLLVWVLLLALPLATSPSNVPEDIRYHFIKHILILNSLLLVVFYLHTYGVYPLLQRKGWFIYVLALVVLLAAYWLCWYFIRSEPPGPDNGMMRHMQNGAQRLPDPNMPRQQHFGPRGGGPGAFIPIVSPFIAVLCSFCYLVLLDDAKRQQAVKERETVHLRTELSLLRSQINPHFLFNILNNLTSLARKRSEQMEPAIINLSQLMRYMLYESDDNKVLLVKEVEYLKSYIDLQMLRFGDEVSIATELNDNYGDRMIDPMLLIALVENAFKHGTDDNENASILIRLRVDPDNNVLYFTVINSFIQSATKPESSGIGLKNLRRRLTILYPEKHDLRIVNNGLLFTAQLSIELS
ncbi:histidine kinase [Mucilaginibacter sp. UR6-1]|uniref:sensor histidine kinase n=1 Tax=Mucilaginibacter sp. UR6-1 TaxID=1435643 RepID=UPI001E2AF7F7|nr:histidine kinase [Mucilaginibacter sp. UR6-1]MCC8408266.1 histidine kinase [Mucilaginibacter sp. UR6-1]